MTTDFPDLVPLDRRNRDARRAAPPASLRGEVETLGARLLTGGDFTRDEPGRWTVVWSDSITGHRWPLDAQQVGDRIVSAHMRPTAVEPLSPAEIDAVLAALVAALDRREAAPVRTAETLGLAAAVARRFARPWRCRLDDRGQLVGHLVADEPGPAQRAERQAAGRTALPWARRSPGVQDVEITPDLVRDHCLRGVLQANESVADWSAVVAEIRALLVR